MSVVLRTVRLLALTLGAVAVGGVLVPAVVAGTPESIGGAGGGSADLTWATVPAPAGRADARAVALLRQAATAGVARAYSGTQTVASWSGAGDSSVMVDLQHLPGRGVLVRRSGGGDDFRAVDAPAATTLDSRALAVLERHYDLTVSTRGGRCAGRPAHILEARPHGEAAVAGRFWLDDATGLVLRRELYDGRGRLVRATAFVDVSMSVPRPWTAPDTPAADSVGSPLGPRQISDLRRAGWRAPGRVAGRLELFDARRQNGAVQLSYTDGLFSVSVFSQPGRLKMSSAQGWQHARLGTTSAWVHPGLSQQVVWAGAGQVYTAVADAPDPVVVEVVAAFPAAGTDSFGRRVVRGLHRMGSWVDPTG